MSSDEIIDASEVTEKSAALDLFFRGIRVSLGNQFKALGNNKTVYSMVALTNPLKIDDAEASVFSNSMVLKQASSLFKEILGRSQGKFIFFARMDEPNTPHSFIPHPCQIPFAQNVQAAAKLIALHTLVISSEASAAGSPIKAGDVVLVRLDKGNIQKGELVGLDTEADIPQEAQACRDLAALVSPGKSFKFSVVGGFSDLTGVATTLDSFTAVSTPISDSIKNKENKE